MGENGGEVDNAGSLVEPRGLDGGNLMLAQGSGAGRNRPPCHHHHPAVRARETQPRCGSRLAAPIAHRL